MKLLLHLTMPFLSILLLVCMLIYMHIEIQFIDIIKDTAL